jgi:DNA-directed RNA polymerase sigma subunit (sigma70/sigma32)
MGYKIGRNIINRYGKGNDEKWKALLNSEINAKELVVFLLRQGLTDMPPMTLKEIARLLKLSPERIRQIEALTNRKLIRGLKKKRIVRP